ncbi:hypothetical protein GOODEAATRI_008092 [Goodea atripinnis]|uniref:Uncharacterized protein n=1 Tax=Goodea atripinnis TaxID=208336 RepID=A0ABV0PW88_9TELE
MWVYRKSLGRPVLRHSLSLRPLSLPVAGAIPWLSFCQNIPFQFSALRLPNSCHRQLDGVDAAKPPLPAHYPAPCHAPSLPGPNRHKLIGLNPVINRLEKKLSMLVSLPKAMVFWPQISTSFFFSPALQFCQPTTASCPVLPSSLALTARARLTSLRTLDVGLKWVTIPPELMVNESQREQIKLKAMEVEEKDLALQAKEYNEGLVATPARTVAKGHAAATVFGKEEFSEEPSSTANKFQPGSWMPTSKK